MSDKYEEKENKNIKEYEFEAPQNRSIKVKNFKGKIIIHGCDEEKVKITARKNDDLSIDLGEDFKLGFVSDEDNVKLEVKCTDEDGVQVHTLANNPDTANKKESSNFIETIFNWVGKKISSALSASVNYDIWIPRDFNVNCDNKSGDYVVDNLNGNIKLTTGHGKIDIDNISGDIDTLTYDGRIEASAINGSFKGKSYNGRVSIIDSELDSAIMTSMNGRLTGRIILKDTGSYKFKTMNGRIMIGIPLDSSVTINSKTMAGKIINQLEPDKGVLKTSRKANITLGEGNAELNATTMNGHIYLVDYDEFDIEEDIEEDATEEDKEDFNIHLDIPKDSEEYQEVKEEINEALNKINDDIRDLLFPDEFENYYEGDTEELNEVIDKFNSLKEDFLNVINEPDLNRLSRKDKDKINEKINLMYEYKLKNLEKELQDKIAKFNSEMQGVDKKFSSRLNSVTSSIDELSKKLKDFPDILYKARRPRETEKPRRPGRPIRTGKNSKASPQSEETKMILSMLKEGKISAEEAEKLLKAINKD